MKKFRYKAKDKEGKTLSGIVEAKDIKQAARVLQERGLLVISLRPHSEGPLKELKEIGFLGRITSTDKVNFTRQLSTMVNAGLPLTEALAVLEAQSRPSMAKIIGDILREVESGGSLSSAMERHKDIFDEVYIALVKAGEAAGILDKVLNRLADNLEKQREFTSKVKGAMLYPAIVIGGMGIVAAIMMIFVIPKMTSLYEEFQADLPLITKIFLKISNLTVAFWPVLLVALVGGVVSLKIGLKKPFVKKRYEEILFKIPIIGPLQKQIMLTEFTRTLGLLIGAGVMVVDALSVVRHSMGSVVYEEAVTDASEEVEKGFPLAAALARTELFPPIVPQMISVGEETGKMDEVLAKISAYFEMESTQSVRNLTTAIEPIIMIVLGVGVGFLMVAIIMPIYNLTSQF